MRSPGHGNDADRCVPVFLYLPGLWRAAAAETWRLLRVLLLRLGAVPAGTGWAELRVARWISALERDVPQPDQWLADKMHATIVSGLTNDRCKSYGSTTVPSWVRGRAAPPSSCTWRDLLFDLTANGAIGDIEIVARLQIDPELRRGPEIASEP